MIVHYKLIGGLLIVLALIHVVFPRYFDWRNELRSLSLVNRQMMMVHTFFIALTVFLMGLLCLFCADDLLHTPLGRNLSLGLGVFWGIRLLIQLFGYSTELWKGKRFETAVHILFIVLWTYLSVIFLTGAFGWR